MEEVQKQQWKNNRDQVKQSIDTLRASPAMIRDLDTMTMLKVTALIYKTYMDNLYFAGEHRGVRNGLLYDSKNATLYNAYGAAFNRCVGMTTSNGCKSANDRTFVERMLIAAINGSTSVYDKETKPSASPSAEVKSYSLDPGHVSIEFKEDKGAKAKPRLVLPPNFHNPKDTKEYDKLMGWVSDNIMSNSATHSCINDTGGGASKVSSGQYYFLEKLKNINFFKKFGKFSPHKLKKGLDNVFKTYDKTLPKEKGRVKQFFSNLFSKSKATPVVNPEVSLGEHKRSDSVEVKSDGPPDLPRHRM